MSDSSHHKFYLKVQNKTERECEWAGDGSRRDKMDFRILQCSEFCYILHLNDLTSSSLSSTKSLARVVIATILGK